VWAMLFLPPHSNSLRSLHNDPFRGEAPQGLVVAVVVAVVVVDVVAVVVGVVAVGAARRDQRSFVS